MLALRRMALLLLLKLRPKHILLSLQILVLLIQLIVKIALSHKVVHHAPLHLRAAYTEQ